MRFVVLHGTGADHKSNWFPWLKAELESKGHEVWVPDLPNTETPNASSWTNYLLNSKFNFNDSVVIGHSAGAVEIQALLQTLPEGVVLKNAVFIGSFRGDLGWKELVAMDVPFDYPIIKTHANKFTVIHSDNDPHCPLDDAQWIAAQLDAEFVLMPNMGHFSLSLDERFTQFPELLEYLEDKVVDV